LPPPPARTISRVEIHRSRQLISDSRALIARAKAFIAQARQSLARQSYCWIVCAWCQRIIRRQHVEGVARGQISHSICFACFTQMFPELTPEPHAPLLLTAVAVEPQKNARILLVNPQDSFRWSQKCQASSLLAAEWEEVVWHASYEVLLPFFTTEIILVVKNMSAECCAAQAYAWAAAMA
jgi:hypothetical protein